MKPMFFGYYLVDELVVTYKQARRTKIFFCIP